MSNLEVAQYLLQHGLEGLDGVLFLNERNERVAWPVAAGAALPLGRCPKPLLVDDCRGLYYPIY